MLPFFSSLRDTNRSLPERRLSLGSTSGDREGQGRAIAELAYFRERWARAQCVLLNYLFESVFLRIWVLFAAWPRLRNASPRSWAVPGALWPLFLFVRHYLGYAPYAFTFGPSGGFVYPDVLLVFSQPVSWITITPVDVAIFQALPRPLSTLSQLTGPATAMSFMTVVGPVGLIAYGLLLGGIIYRTRGIVECRVTGRRSAGEERR